MGRLKGAKMPTGTVDDERTFKRRIILVPGMHRSGTSALTRVINLLGATIPGPVVPPMEGNSLGHWEPQSIVQLHEDMLRSARLNVNSVFAVPEAWFAGSDAERFTERLSQLLKPHLEESGLPIIKDPRMAHFLPVWKLALDALNVQALIVLPFRDPLEVAASLRARQLQAFPDSVWPMGRGVLLWLRHVLDAERASRGLHRAFVSYEALLNDWRSQVGRMETQLNFLWTDRDADKQIDATLCRQHRHQQRPHLDGDLAELAQRVHGLLEVATERADDQHSAFDEARSVFEQACTLFASYVQGLEFRLGENPSLRTEYSHFLEQELDQRPVRSSPTSATIHAALIEENEERRRSLMVSAGAQNTGTVRRCSELEFFNEALLSAARRIEHLHAEELRAVRNELDEVTLRCEGAEARAAASGKASADATASALATSESATVWRRLAEQAKMSALAKADELLAHTAELERQLATTSTERDGLLMQVEHLREFVATLHGSTSWRLTAPIRALVTWLKR